MPLTRGPRLLALVASLVCACSAATTEPRWTERRLVLVKSIEAQGVRDSCTLVALRAVPRHEFVPAGYRERAYEDRALPIEHEQTISQPYVVAFMTEALRPRPGMKVLEIGTGSGYQAAVLDRIGCRVFTIEIIGALAESARSRLQRLGHGRVQVRHGDGYLGWPEEAPFDGILLTAAPESVPQALIDQLAPGGRLVAPVGPEDGSQELILLEKDRSGVVKRTNLLPVRFVPMRTDSSVGLTPSSPPFSPETRVSVDSLIGAAYEAGWDSLSIGERVGRFARALEGAPYLDGTLEGPGPEVCRITTRGYDCVTFMELCLDLARVVRPVGAEPRPDADDLLREVQRTRYRGGRLAGYASRLHYTSEWIADNVAKGVIEDVTPSLGGVPLPLALSFMSTHPASYAALAADSALVDSIRAIEVRASRIPRTYVPRSRVAAIEGRLRTGDLIAIAASIPGLDYSHTGTVYKDATGAARLLHASTRHRRVVLDDRVSEYLVKAPKSVIGITVMRPLASSGGR